VEPPHGLIYLNSTVNQKFLFLSIFSFTHWGKMNFEETHMYYGLKDVYGFADVESVDYQITRLLRTEWLIPLIFDG